MPKSHKRKKIDIFVTWASYPFSNNCILNINTISSVTACQFDLMSDLLNLYYHIIVIFVSTWIYLISLWIFLININSKMTLFYVKTCKSH